MSNITVAEAAWAAGIIDGEGSIFIMKQSRKDRERAFNYILRVSVQSADKCMTPELKRLFPDGAEFTQRVENRPNMSNTWKWQLNGKKATAMLKTILPYMKVKVNQAKAAIEFQETTKKHWKNMSADDYSKQEEFYYLLKQLKIDEKVGNDTEEYQVINTVLKSESDERAA